MRPMMHHRTRFRFLAPCRVPVRDNTEIRAHWRQPLLASCQSLAVFVPHVHRFSTLNNQGQPSGNDDQDRYLTVPNALTMIRMGLAPYVSYALFTGEPVTAFGAFVFAGALDAIDGWVARKFDQASVIGSYLDPLADKVLIACAAGSLTWLGIIPWWAVLVMVGRDAGLVAGGIWHRATTRPEGAGFFSVDATTLQVEPSELSKANTALQIVCMTAGLTQAAWSWPGQDAVTGLAALAACTTLASGYGYWRKLPYATIGKGKGKLP